MSSNFMLLYISTVFIASIIPGPSMLLALSHGMQYGARKTIASALGNLTVTLIQASISIAGLGTILIASELAFYIVKMAGAAYLVYMGITILLSEKMTLRPENHPQAQNEVSWRKMYLQAALVTGANPKAIAFFTAIFPQFINPETAYLPQFCLLMSVGSFIAFSCFMLYAIGGQRIVFLFTKANFGKYLNRIIGTSFIGAGISLAARNR